MKPDTKQIKQGKANGQTSTNPEIERFIVYGQIYAQAHEDSMPILQTLNTAADSGGGQAPGNAPIANKGMQITTAKSQQNAAKGTRPFTQVAERVTDLRTGADSRMPRTQSRFKTPVKITPNQ